MAEKHRPHLITSIPYKIAENKMKVASGLALILLPFLATYDKPANPLLNFKAVGDTIRSELLVILDGNTLLQNTCNDSSKVTFQISPYPLEAYLPNSLGIIEEGENKKLTVKILDSEGLIRKLDLDDTNKMPRNWGKMERSELVASIQEIIELHELWHACAWGIKDITDEDLIDMHLDLAAFLNRQLSLQNQVRVGKVESKGFAFKTIFITNQGSIEQYYFMNLEENVTEWMMDYQAKRLLKLSKVLKDMKPGYSKSHVAFLDYLASGDDDFIHEVAQLKSRGDIIGFRNLLIERITQKLQFLKLSDKREYTNGDIRRLARKTANQFINTGTDPTIVINYYVGDAAFSSWLTDNGFQVKVVDQNEINIKH